MLAISTTELSKEFTAGRGRDRRRVEAVRDITFSVERGERLAYIGPNGAGKSTSIKMLTGILHPTRGEATVLGLAPLRPRHEVLFLDEPTIGLDLIAKQRFREMVVRLNEEQGTTVFLTSHDVADIEHVADRVVVINHGTIIYDDQVGRMRRSLLQTKLLEVRFEEAPGTLEMDGVHVTSESDTVYGLVVDTRRLSVREVLDELLDNHAIADISVVDPPLEQVISEIYEGRT
jgi:ABC-type uncharacterized transport system ATPase subunit